MHVDPAASGDPSVTKWHITEHHKHSTRLLDDKLQKWVERCSTQKTEHESVISLANSVVTVDVTKSVPR